VEEEEAKKKREEEEKRRKEEEEQCVHEEEKCKRKVEDERLHKLAEFKKNEDTSLARLKEQKKATREEKAARKALQEEGTERNKGKKRARSESGLGLGNEDEGGGTIIGGMVQKDRVTWKVDDKRICYPCGKAHRRCLWRKDGAKRVKACYHCNESRKKCSMMADSDMSEARLPRKKRAAVGKGETKVEAVPVASGSGMGLVNVMERLVAEIQRLRGEFREVNMNLGRFGGTVDLLRWT
jgi:hypothetical protein